MSGSGAVVGRRPPVPSIPSSAVARSALAGDGDRRDRQRPARSSATAQAASVAPVVTTSSTSRTQRPRPRPPLRPRAVRAGTRRPRSPPARRDRARTGRPSPGGARGPDARAGRGRCAGDVGDERRLVVAAPPLALGVDRDRNDDLGTGADPRPAPGDCRRRAGPASRRSPAYLRSWRACPDRRRRRARTIRAGAAARAGRPAARSASRRAGPAGRRAPARTRAQNGSPSRPHPEQEAGKARSSAAPVEPAQRGHRRDDGRRPLYPALTRAGRLGVQAPTTGHRPPSRCARSCRRQLEHPVRAADERHEPGPGPEAAMDGHDGRAPPRARIRPAQEDGVDREAHEHHVDPVRCRAATGPAPASSDGRPIRPMNLPHSAVGDLEPVGEVRRAAEVAGAQWRGRRGQLGVDVGGRV